MVLGQPYLVVQSVTRNLPQIEVEDVGGDHFLIASFPILVADERDQLVVDPRTVREPEAAAGRQVVEEEQLLLGAEVTMVALLGLLLELQPLLQHALVRERYAVDSLQRVVRHLASNK